jgi:hypothetical protein
MRMKQASRAQLVPAGKAALKVIRRYTSRAPLLCELDNFLRLLERLVLLEIKTYSRLVVTRVQRVSRRAASSECLALAAFALGTPGSNSSSNPELPR